ncbi:hypothetical protein, partial [Pseudomonas koreensis]|uniref:hypothetical protein n=1 Tax=Pseudomonas koreensis TaxID=198620 RepID=UPI0020775F5B
NLVKIRACLAAGHYRPEHKKTDSPQEHDSDYPLALESMARIFERLFPLCLWPGIDGIKRVENRIYACQQFAIQSGFEVKRSSTTGSNRPTAAVLE